MVATKTTTRVDNRSRRWVEVEVEVAVVVGAMASVCVFSVDVLGVFSVVGCGLSGESTFFHVEVCG